MIEYGITAASECWNARCFYKEDLRCQSIFLLQHGSSLSLWLTLLSFYVSLHWVETSFNCQTALTDKPPINNVDLKSPRIGEKAKSFGKSYLHSIKSPFFTWPSKHGVGSSVPLKSWETLMICATDNCHSSLLSTHLSCLLYTHTFATGSSRQMCFSFLNTQGGDIFFVGGGVFPATSTCFIKEVNVGEESAFPSKLVALGWKALRWVWVCKHAPVFAQLMPQSSLSAGRARPALVLVEQKVIKPGGKREISSLRESQMIPHSHLWALVEVLCVGRKDLKVHTGLSNHDIP